jgi:dolichol-phosphate mannosyltransferase
MAGKDYSQATVVMPTLNEAKCIGEILDLVSATCPGIGIVVADDGSRDGTQEIVRERAKRGVRARLLDRSNATVKGNAVSILDGIRAAGTEYVVVMDADLQHPVGKVPELLDALSSGNGLAIGTRVKTSGWPISRVIMSAGANIISRAALMLRGCPCPKDPVSGFYGMTAETAAKIHADAINGSGFKLLLDMLFQLRNGEVRIAEVPYEFSGREQGESKLNYMHILQFLKSVAVPARAGGKDKR